MKRIVVLVLVLVVVSISFAGCIGNKEPDIRKTDLSTNPNILGFRKEPLESGIKVVIHVTLTNFGDAKGTGTVQLKIDGTPVDQDSAIIYPQSSKTLTLSYRVRKGKHRITVIGPNGVIAEKKPAKSSFG